MTGIDKQKKWFEKLDDVIETPIYTARNWRDGSDKFVPGKQHPLGTQVPPIDHRSIGSNEVVIELDAKSFSLNSKYAGEIKKYLTAQEIPAYYFWSGNKSIHIHIWLDIDVKDNKILEVVKKAIKTGCNIYRDIRVRLAREIVTQAGLSPSLIGVGKPVDMAKLSWNDTAGKTCLIRACGGENKKVDAVGTIKSAFKTFLEILPEKKPVSRDRPFSYDEVLYPKDIKMYKLDEEFVFDVATHYNELQNNPRMIKELTEIDYKGKFLGLPCTRTIVEGIGEGKRSFGAQQLAVACRLDNLSKKKAYEVLDTYCSNCTPHLDVKEAHKWVDWVYGLVEPYFACGNCKNLDVCQIHGCPYHEEKYKEDLEIFNSDNPLAIIKEALDVLIVGEDNLKMQLFLLYLTKEFGPEWCIMLDGTASSGKTHVMKKVATLFGEEREAYFTYSRITEAVLNHAEVLAEEWDGKIIIIEELQGAAKVVQQLRVLISEGQLTYLGTAEDKDSDGTKKLIAEEKVVKFNCLFVTCNAEESDEGDQLTSRSWILNTDQSPEQTTKIVQVYLNEFKGDKNFNVKKLDQIRSALQFLKVPDIVWFPFADEMARFIANTTVRARRDVKKLITLVKSVAYFNQKNRVWFEDKNKQQVLVADWRDVLITMDLAGETLNASTQGVGSNDLASYEEIVKNTSYVPIFTIEDVSRWLKCGPPTARKVMSNLCRAGFFENTILPPQKAKYAKTSLNPAYLDKTRQYCCDNLINQDEKLLNILKKTIPNCTKKALETYKELLSRGIKDYVRVSEPKNGAVKSHEENNTNGGELDSSSVSSVSK